MTSGDERGEDDDIPLNIAGHEDREPPSGSDSASGERSDPRAGEKPDGASSMRGSDDGGGDADGDAAEAHAVDRPKPPGEDDEDDVQPVEVLVQLAKDDEIEPWDIDIVTVTDKFLDRLDEADLRTSGRALFYASVLLRMKSDAMLSDDEDEEEEPEPWEAAAMGEDTPLDSDADPFASLEKEMDRRLDRKRARGMPQTLDELVRDLREAERDTWWKESREYDTSDSPSTYQRGTQELDYRSGDEFRMDDEPTAADVTGTAHGEDIDAIIDDVYGACLEQWEAGREEVLYAEIENAGGSRVETFLGLLFLSHRGQVYLQQDDLFGDLWIQDPNAAQGSEEAIAD
ncbi:segregation/condensation protein A [Halorientalis regularis]|jgi:segregation and condensation protein A|uniref:Condensin subunit ScpA n=1 Tax=Halorientalis regularis TaxID=660518 RepID=A0A1G7J6X8_9EURY|nr:segregation/condensation protein A [Halorientalis regularis]SDF20653.1 condensin subunit ScpA [Halorientalis regularis]